MKKFLFLMSIIAALFFIFNACSISNQAKIAGNYQYKTECLGIKDDGTQILKAWGSGRNMSNAIIQAQKNAVYDVILNGIMDGNPECEIHPIVSEVNAHEKYETYFNKFFKDGGAYRKFVSLKDEQMEIRQIRDHKEGIGKVTYSAVVTVKRSLLKEKMITDGILKTLNIKKIKR